MRRRRRIEDLFDPIDGLEALDNRSFEDGYDDPADDEGSFSGPTNEWPVDPQ